MSSSYGVLPFQGAIRSGQSSQDVSRQLEELLNRQGGREHFALFAAVNVRIEPGCLAGLLGRSVGYEELNQVLFAPDARAYAAMGALTATPSTVSITESAASQAHSPPSASDAAQTTSRDVATAIDSALVSGTARRWPKATPLVAIAVAAVLIYSFSRPEKQLPASPAPVAVVAPSPVVTPTPPTSRVQPQPTASPVPPSTEAVPAPDFRVGDRWVTDAIDHQDAKLNSRSERVVTAMPAGRIVTTVRNVKSNYTRTIEYDRQWGLIAARLPSGAATMYSPAIQYLKFPAKPGDSWRVESTETSSTGELKSHLIIASVDGWEMVAVPAGTFRALKVVLRDELRDKGVVVQQGEDVSWYVPNVRRTVKTEESSYTPKTGERRRRSIVLVEYSVQR